MLRIDVGKHRSRKVEEVPATGSIGIFRYLLFFFKELTV